MNTTWIKRSEREPTRADYPVVSGGFINSGEWDEVFWYAEIGMAYKHTHWRSVKADPPARELTQRELDDKAAMEAAAGAAAPYGYSNNEIKAARRAIYAERREVAKLLTQYFGDDCWRKESEVPDMRDIAARLDEQGAK